MTFAPEMSVKGTATSPRSVAVVAYPATAWPQIAPLWLELVNASTHSSFFLRPEWTESWLEIFGPLLKPQILVFESEGQTVGACLLVNAIKPRGPFRVRLIILNTGGEEEMEETCMEFNSLLCRPGWERAVAAALCNHLQALVWDEFVVNYACQGTAASALETAFANFRQITMLRRSYYVDLARLRRSKASYESILSRNTREQLRRSLKLYRQRGEVRTEAAYDVASALELLDKLSKLHQQNWTGRGTYSGFSSPHFLAFHRSLVRRAFPQGMVQLLHVVVGEQTIGMLYNFIWRGKVSYYASALQYSEDNRLKPGFVTHACAIHYCLEQGLDEYDFLAGDQRYKKSMATDSRQLAWMVFRRTKLRLQMIEFLRWVKHKLKKEKSSDLPSHREGTSH